MTTQHKAPKYEFLDGLRGIAALQVVFLHYCAAFLPAFARAGVPEHYKWETLATNSPAFLLVQGYVAVYVFFIMSGFVLANSFLDSRAPVVALAVKRCVRLYLPVLASVLLAGVLMFMFRSVKQQAVDISMSSWLHQQWEAQPDLHLLMKDVIVNSMIVGYGQASVFSAFPAFTSSALLTPMVGAVNPPLWTLHLEFWGSMVLLIITILIRNLSAWWTWVAMLTLFVLSGTSFLMLFLVGFACCLISRSSRPTTSRARSIAGAILLFAGCVAACMPTTGTIQAVHELTRSLPIMHALDPFQLQCEISALLLFSGVFLWPAMRSLLSSKVPQWLGKVSFSLYLVHFSILLTLGCAVFSWLHPHGYLMAFFGATSIGTLVSLYAAALFGRAVDQKSIRLAQKVMQLTSSMVSTRQRPMEREIPRR
ncbi:hypothetical protein WS87_09655 [Burkholderia sp. MSMB0856]|uniref:acyltransferase family protein n=1 Tax=Burkholderia sp. MSMB0856 TaxID=1637869 RepID=UPI000752361C|nr:acyltransferase [Burkholderia sp. MSMB0856]AOJ86922.1 hypothetical protein WS87_09655 [Burkholderia sp. MSMB0856]KVH36713.1 hypothetical protein WS87_12370 [Burkholderia sp. MSMB0856]